MKRSPSRYTTTTLNNTIGLAPTSVVQEVGN